MIVFWFHRLPEFVLFFLIGWDRRRAKKPTVLAEGERCGVFLGFLYACRSPPHAGSSDFRRAVASSFLVWASASTFGSLIRSVKLVTRDTRVSPESLIRVSPPFLNWSGLEIRILPVS